MNKQRFAAWAGVLLLSAACFPFLTLWAAPAKRAKKLRARLYGSLTRGVSASRAKAVTRPMVNLLARRVRYPIENFDIEPGDSAKDLLALGRKLQDGTYHLAIVWGIEFGWLRQRYPGLRAMALASSGNNAPWRSQLIARRKDRPRNLAALKGKRLARIRGAALMDQLFLEDMLRKAGQQPQGFFQHGPPLPNVKEALLAVKNGQADCVMVNLTDFARFTSLQPKLAQALVEVERSDPYPAPVLMGNYRNVERLKPGLWKKFQDEVVRIHATHEGKQIVRFWRLDSFIRPGRAFDALVQKTAQRFPLEKLANQE
jgi:ABC-type phosphate/phosphonate transport system substrate-binding protein